jgi:hypothetical protein
MYAEIDVTFVRFQIKTLSNFHRGRDVLNESNSTTKMAAILFPELPVLQNVQVCTHYGLSGVFNLNGNFVYFLSLLISQLQFGIQIPAMPLFYLQVSYYYLIIIRTINNLIHIEL